jgi:hypothetical protein
MVDAPLDEIGEYPAVAQRAIGIVGHLTTPFRAHVPIAVFLDAALVVLWNPEQHPDHAQWHHRAEVLDEIEMLTVGQRVEAPLGELTDHRFELIDLARSEGTRQQIAVDVVHRRVLEDQEPGRYLHV